MNISGEPGENVFQFFKRAKVEAYLREREIIATFNGVSVNVNPHSYPYDLVTIWQLRMDALKNN